MRFGSDTGGTFTDLVGADGRITKVLSTPDDPGRAVRAGLAELAGLAERGGRPEVLAHGTTVGTNALLERRGATVALVTNDGFTDLIEIGRQDRPSLYDLTADRPDPLVARAHRYGVVGRVDGEGREIEPLDLSTLPPLADAVESVAVALLHADLEPAHERAVTARLVGLGYDVSASHDVSPEFREFERTITTVVNAYLRPACRTYLRALSSAADEVLVMTSGGGLVPAEVGAEQPVRLLLSGPAGGVLAGAAAASANGWPDAVTFDMGGTSTDVCLVLGGEPAPAAERVLGGWPLRVPSMDVHTIGAGGGSIARIDAGGALTVGPRSAGAEPGPVCYGRGGTEPTVTDADLVTGRLPADVALAGLGPLDADAATKALDARGIAAEGVIAVVEAAMVQAVRAVSVERGVDPAGLALVAFGGAGPLHACALADALGMPAVIVPARAGVFSAVGILCADEQRDLVRSWPTPSDHAGLDGARRALEAEAAALFDADDDGDGDVEVSSTLDCRYAGQSFELRVDSVDDFGAEHERRNGYRAPDAPIEVVALRARARRRAPLAIADLGPGAVAERRAAGMVGPVAVAEPDCAIWVPDGWRGELGAAGALVLRRVEERGVVSLDPAALQILVSRLGGVAEEMSDVLRRAAFSPNIKERADCSAAVFTASGELLAQAENIPIHLGSMPASVAAAIDRFDPATSADPVGPGDQIVLNDPYAGGTHLNDITVVAPCFVGDRLVGWVANRAHHADVGGSAPGSLPADATEIYAEGLRISPVRLTPEVHALVLANSRTPTERSGDLDAQVGANRVGAARLAAFADEPLQEVLAYGERRLRAVLGNLPDGSWEFTDVLDSFGPAPEQQVETPIHVTVGISGEEIAFDFSGTGPQRAGNVNAVEAVTISAVAFALRAACDPTLPANGGTMRPVTVVAPLGTLVNARPPAAVGAGNVEVSQRVADVCFGALAQVRPGWVGAASQGTMNNLLIGNDRWVYYETTGGGQGGRASGPGMSGVHTHMTNARNTPIEALERTFPMRVRRLRLRQGSGGAGAAPGGEGVERDLEVLEAAVLSLITERRRSAPWGIDGGGPGASGENWLLPGGDEARARRLPDKVTMALQPGDVVRILTPGGGGWGLPG